MRANRTRAGLYLVCISRAGYRHGAQLIEFIEDWQRFVSATGREGSIEEFIRWTRRYARRTVFERIALFRTTFPQLGPQGLPHDLMAPLLERLAAQADEQTVRADAAALGVTPDELRGTRGYDPRAR